MNRICRIVSCLAAVLTVGVEAADQSIGLQHNSATATIESPPAEAFWEHFRARFDDRVDEMFADRLHPFNVMNWNMELADGNSDRVRERGANATSHALSKSAVSGLREAAVDLPVMLWLKERQGLLADFLRNSLNEVGEEEVSPLDVSYRLVERSWWQRLSENGDVRYGIRPFRTNPYAFMSMGIKDGDALLMLAHMRYHYRNFAEHLFEIALSVPLAHGFSIDLGSSYRFGRDGEQAGLVVKLFKELKSGGILHVGLEARERSAFFAGIALPW